jgi:type IV secretion system protein VirD4
MRNYAGHRLAPWLAHVMVSRQETARALLTPGEVMQLSPSDELVLISGHPPIRAKKLRYYEDRRFTARVLPAPSLDTAGYRDLPAARPDDWAEQVCGVDIRMAAGDDIDEGADAGGLEQARHPAHEIEPATMVEPEIADPLGLGEDDGDQAAERRTMDRVQALGTARTVYGFDAASGSPDDLQLGF